MAFSICSIKVPRIKGYKPSHRIEQIDHSSRLRLGVPHGISENSANPLIARES